MKHLYLKKKKHQPSQKKLWPNLMKADYAFNVAAVMDADEGGN